MPFSSDFDYRHTWFWEGLLTGAVLGISGVSRNVCVYPAYKLQWSTYGFLKVTPSSYIPVEEKLCSECLRELSQSHQSHMVSSRLRPHDL